MRDRELQLNNNNSNNNKGLKVRHNDDDVFSPPNTPEAVVEQVEVEEEPLHGNIRVSKSMLQNEATASTLASSSNKEQQAT